MAATKQDRDKDKRILELTEELERVRRNCIELGREYWLDSYEISIRDWKTEDGQLAKKSFVIEPKSFVVNQR